MRRRRRARVRVAGPAASGRTGPAHRAAHWTAARARPSGAAAAAFTPPAGRPAVLINYYSTELDFNALLL